MRVLLFVVFFAIFSESLAQSDHASFEQNTNLTCKLLDTLKTQIDTSFKQMLNRIPSA